MRPPGHRGRHPGQEALHHQVRRRPRPRPRPRQPQLHRQPTRCPVGRRLHLLLDVVGRRLRRLHHRRLLPTAGRLESCPVDDRRPRRRRPQHGRLDAGGTPVSTSSSAIPTPARNTRRCSTPSGSTRSVPTRPSGPSVIRYDNAMAESVMGIFKTELHRNPAALADNGGPWKGLDDLEIATCAWVSWFNEERLHSRTQRPDAGRGRSRLPSQVSARCGMRNPN